VALLTCLTTASSLEQHLHKQVPLVVLAAVQVELVLMATASLQPLVAHNSTGE
jgi:hypothetical protein